MPLSEATGWGRPRLRGGGERFSRLRSSGRVSDYGAANRGTHFSRPHLQGAVGRYMNCQVRARLMLRSKLLRCRRTDAQGKSAYGLLPHGKFADMTLPGNRKKGGRSSSYLLLALRGDQFVGCCRHIKPIGLGLRGTVLSNSTVRVLGRSGGRVVQSRVEICFCVDLLHNLASELAGRGHQPGSVCGDGCLPERVDMARASADD